MFDTGHTDVFIKNAKTLGIDIQKEVDTVILSRVHWDHGDGLQYIKNKTLITHPDVFIKRFRNRDHSSIGLKLSKGDIEQKFKLIFKDEPYYISDNIVCLGHVPRLNDFEPKTTSSSDAFGQPDFVLDDSAIAVIQDKELIVITACSHPGICNIIDYACKITGINSVRTVIGGFHLKQNNLQTKQTINFLKKMASKKFTHHIVRSFLLLQLFMKSLILNLTIKNRNFS